MTKRFTQAKTIRTKRILADIAHEAIEQKKQEQRREVLRNLFNPGEIK